MSEHFSFTELCAISLTIETYMSVNVPISSYYKLIQADSNN